MDEVSRLQQEFDQDVEDCFSYAIEEPELESEDFDLSPFSRLIDRYEND